MSIDELTALFAKLGARRPEGWAQSQAEDGINQLHRFLFLRQAWSLVVAEGSTAWIEEARSMGPKGPGGGLLPALERAFERGVLADDLTEIVRVMQWKLLFSLCYLLDDPGELEPEVAHIAWDLFAVDEQGNPTDKIEALWEDILGTDPTGREMCPRP